MELEQRVKTLEYEMKILKNEVQRTLLDIQEQVLVHYYPALRADETKPSEGTIQAMQALRNRPASQPPTEGAPAESVPPASTTPLASTTPPAAVAPPAPATPTLKKVSLEEIRAAQNELASEEGSKGNGEGNGNNGGKGSGNDATERGSVKLLEWLMNNAAKVGDGRDEKQVNQMLDELTKLKALVGDASNTEEALKRIEEAKLG